MDTLAKRLKYARKKRRLTQPQLFERSGVKQSDISKIENGLILKSTGLIALARALACNPAWLDSGDGESWLDSDPNVQPVNVVQGLVPILSFVQAGAWCDTLGGFQPSDAEDWIPCPVKHGPSTFCLIVEGESMFDPAGKYSYGPGDIIYVDPSRDAHHGDRVVVRLDDHRQATFKQLIEEDGRRLLKALNPDWKPRYIEINGNATICGVVIGKLVRE